MSHDYLLLSLIVVFEKETEVEHYLDTESILCSIWLVSNIYIDVVHLKYWVSLPCLQLNMQRPTTARTSESSHAPDLRSRISDHILKGRGCFSWAGHHCKCQKYSVVFFDVWIICCFWCSTTLILARKGTSDCKCVAWVSATFMLHFLFEKEKFCWLDPAPSAV